MNIRLTEEEHDARSIGEEKLRLALGLLNVRGYVVVENVYQEERLLRLGEAAERIRQQERRGEEGPFALPVASPFIDADAAENPLVLGIVDEVLGADCILRAITAGTGIPGAGVSNEVRIEAQPLFPETEHVRIPAHKLHVAIPLAGLTAANGAIEVWPGTHAQPEHLVKKYGMDAVRAIAEAMPSVRVQVPAGAVLIRDSKLWHREQPSGTGEAAACLNMTYQRWWDITSPRQTVPGDVYENASPRLKRLLRFEAVPHRKKAEPSY